VDVPKTLLVTNDYPPRVGGIQRTLQALASELPAERLAVVAPRYPGWRRFDATQDYEIIREPSAFAWPTPAFARRLEASCTATGAEVVLFGDAMPLAVTGRRVLRSGVPFVVLVHGFDYWMSVLPGPHAAMRHVTDSAACVLGCSHWLSRVVRTAVPASVPVGALTPGADPRRFRPDAPTADLRRSLDLGDRPVVVCVSRLVARKGQDVLIRAMPAIRERAPGATLVIVGDGPHRRRLERLAAAAPSGSVAFVGEVADGDLPRYYALGDVFAMPCRSRLGGLEVEGWGTVFLEAAAAGRPVVAGDSGGVREALIPGETGTLVDGARTADVARAVGDLLVDPERAALMGKLGRERVERAHTWTHVAARLARWLRRAAAASGPAAPSDGTLAP
jgi:phosphatidyl-myo-inositol dimannoside synthase